MAFQRNQAFLLAGQGRLEETRRDLLRQKSEWEQSDRALAEERADARAGEQSEIREIIRAGPPSLIEEFDLLVEESKQAEDAAGHARRATDLAGSLEQARRRIAEQDDEIRRKTEALRRLNDERDPSHFDSKIRDAVAAATVEKDAEVVKLRTELAGSRSEVEALRASKKKLREALERTKETRR